MDDNFVPQCPKCNEIFVSNSAMIKHYRSEHGARKTENKTDELVDHQSLITNKEDSEQRQVYSREHKVLLQLRNQSLPDNRDIKVENPISEVKKEEISLFDGSGMQLPVRYLVSGIDFNSKEMANIENNALQIQESKVDSLQYHNESADKINKDEKGEGNVAVIRIKGNPDHKISENGVVTKHSTDHGTAFQSEYSDENVMNFKENNTDIQDTSNDSHDGFKCHLCEKIFKSKYKLKEHTRKRHPKNTLNFTCEYCGKIFNSNEYLKAHMYVHKNMAFTCSECDYKTKYPSNLTCHKRTKHSGIKYYCDTCTYVTDRKERLKQHIDVKHSGNLHSCDFNQCLYKGTSTALYQHKKIKHKSTPPQ